MSDKKVPEKRKGESMGKPKDNESKSHGVCFVVMPFSDWFNKYYEEIYEPAIRGAGLEPKRADSIFKPSVIVEDIWKLTNEAVIIVAELSTQNPNVYYELGLAHAISKPVILVSDVHEDIPFDIRHRRIIQYDMKDPYWGTNLKDSLIKFISETLDSPDEAILPAFRKVDESKEPVGIAPIEREVDDIRRQVQQIRQELESKKPFWEQESSSMLNPFIAPGLANALLGTPSSARQVYRNELMKAALKEERKPAIDIQAWKEKAKKEIKDLLEQGNSPNTIVSELKDRYLSEKFLVDVMKESFNIDVD